MIPARSSRWTRSATAGDDRLTRRPSSASETLPSVASSPMIFRSVWSIFRRSLAITAISPSFSAQKEINAFDQLCPFRTRAATISHPPSSPVTARIPLAARIDAVPAQAYFVGSAVFHYLGPSFAVLLFARVDVLGVAWMRIASAALVFAAWRRPWRKLRALDRRGRLLIAALGAVFAAMNTCFYISIDRLPLATVAAIEFIGPIALAAVGARTSRNLVAVSTAAAGVYHLTNVRFSGEPV